MKVAINAACIAEENGDALLIQVFISSLLLSVAKRIL